MAASSDDFSGRPNARTRPSASNLRDSTQSPRTPKSSQVPALGRSISSQFGSPGSFRSEQEDVIIYELGARHISAGYAGESRPRCIVPFTPDATRRVGDYRPYDPQYLKESRHWRLEEEWGAGYELYKTDLRELDLGLVEDRLDRMQRTLQHDHLQLDAKPRRAILIVPSMLPTPLLEIALRVLFGHPIQPPSISILTNPVMCCVSAGLRHALVIDIGWEETTITAIGEYKEVSQRRSIRAGKLLTREMGNTIEERVRKLNSQYASNYRIAFPEAEDTTIRMSWCQQRPPAQTTDQDQDTVSIWAVNSEGQGAYLPIQFSKLAEPAEKAFFTITEEHDDHDSPLHQLSYRALLSLPLDLRALCLSRIIITGGPSKIPGLKRRLLQELTHLISTRGWDPVSNYGSAKKPPLGESSPNILPTTTTSPRKSKISLAFEEEVPVPLSPTKMPLQDSLPHVERVHDDIKDPITLKAEREANKGKPEIMQGVVRGVETLGPWAGASLMASMRIKGSYEIERENFVKYGLRNGVRDI